MPKENKSYSCLVCGERYSTYERAEECEKTHKIPCKVSKPEYTFKDRKMEYPLSVLVHFKDDSSARYFRKQ